MTHRLTIDRGNTALKGALWDDRGALLCVHTSAGHAPLAKMVKALLEQAPGAIDTVAYSSVVRQLRTDDLAVATSLGTRVIDLSADTPLPFAIAYRTPSTLGADRIAAIAGALELAGNTPVLVVDMGTAITYDLVEFTPAQGHTYIGGNIAAGNPMRLHALHEHTSALPEVSPDMAPSGIWGSDTAEALLNGAVYGTVAELAFYRAHAPENTVTVLTGGGAEYLRHNNLIDFEHIYDPHLVLRGLNSIISYNENS